MELFAPTTMKKLFSKLASSDKNWLMELLFSKIFSDGISLGDLMLFSIKSNHLENDFDFNK